VERRRKVKTEINRTWIRNGKEAPKPGRVRASRERDLSKSGKGSSTGGRTEGRRNKIRKGEGEE